MYELSFSIEPAQFREFQALAARHALGWARYLVPAGFMIIAVAFILLPTICSWSESDGASFGAGVLGMYIAGFLYYCFLIQPIISRYYTSSKGSILGQRRLTADDKALNIAGEHYTSSHDWAAIHGVSAGKNIMVLWTDNGAGVIIPKSAFKSPAEIDEFKRYVEGKIATQAKQASP